VLWKYEVRVNGECVFQGVILKITNDGRCLVGRILHGGMMHKLGKHESQCSLWLKTALHYSG